MTPRSRRLLGGSSLAVAICVIALVGSGSATATFPGRNGLIAFASDRDPLLLHPQVFSLSVHGGQPRNLSASAADDYDPAPSPDGRLIAFSRRGEIWLMNNDGSGQRLLAHGGSQPTWSPNGRTIAFNGGGPGDCPPEAFRCGHLVAVWTVRVDGSALRRHETATRNASWSPSGRRIAYEGGIDPYGSANGIRVANADGTKPRWVARKGAQPAWSPSGRLIAYSSNRGIHVVRPDGTGRRGLAAGGWSPSWARRGDRLAYACGRPHAPEGAQTTFALCVIDAAGHRRRTVAQGVVVSATSAGRDRVEVAWSPRALRFAYIRPEGIFLVDADGRHRRRVAQKEKTLLISSLAWSADGRRLSFAQTRDRNDLEIYTSGADGSAEQLTRNGVEDLQPSWAADGRRLAFVRLGAGRVHIWVMNADGSGQRLVGRNGVEPSWTSDGSRIVFTRFTSEPNSTYSLSVATGREELLVRGGIHGAPSPDGTKIAFVRGSLGSYRLFVAAADGSGETFLAPGGGRLSWSPDSTTVAFEGCTNVPGVCTIQADGTGLEHVPFDEPRAHLYSFSPDGTTFTFVSGTGYPTSQVEVSGIDGSGRRVLTAARGRNGDPDWQPLQR